MEGDASCYWFMGKMMKKGMLPYLDFYDHKGPMLFFIECLGNLLSSDTTGIFIIQIIALTVTVWGIYKTALLFWNRKKSVVFSLMSFLISPYSYTTGNLTEEYCLPFLVLSIYLGTAFLINKDKNQEKHKPLYAFFYGITFMYCALIRVTNALPMMCIIFVVFLTLCYRKKWINILQNAGMFVLGAIALAAPFVVYYIKIDAFYEMIYATFIYNAKYVVNNSSTTINAPPITIFTISIYYIFCIVVSLVHLLFYREYKKLSASVLMMGCLGLYFQLMSRPFPHYTLVWMPMIILALCLYSDKKPVAGFLKIISSVLLLAFISYTLLYDSVIIRGNINRLKNNEYTAFKEASLDIAKEIPEKNKDSFVCYNVDTSFYCVTDLYPCYKFFMYQDWHSGISTNTKKEIRKEFETLKAEYIVTLTDEKNGISDILERHYRVEKMNSELTLWKLVQ